MWIYFHPNIFQMCLADFNAGNIIELILKADELNLYDNLDNKDLPV